MDTEPSFTRATSLAPATHPPLIRSAPWAGGGPDVKRDGHPEIDADHGIIGR